MTLVELCIGLVVTTMVLGALSAVWFAVAEAWTSSLAPAPAAIIDEVPTGRLFVDGAVIVETEDEAIRDRKRLAAEGAVNVALAVNGKHAIVAGPTVTVRGLSMPDEDDFDLALEDLERTAQAAFTKLNHS